MPDESRRKVGYGNVNPKGGNREGLGDKERPHQGALAEAARRAEHPEEYPGHGESETHWAREQMNRGPSTDYVGHNRKFDKIPDSGVGEPPAGTVGRAKREREGA